MPRLLTWCCPTYGPQDALHIDPQNQSVILAPDEMHVYLRQLGWEIDVVSLASPTEKRLRRSRLPLHRPEEVNLAAYDLYWQMFRDPTRSEDLLKLQDYDSPVEIPVINAAGRLKDHHKFRYAPLLHRYGLGPAVHEHLCSDPTWRESAGNRISPDGCLIESYAWNNHRGARDRLVTEYVDNANDGVRSLVRFGFCYGNGFRGFQYFSSLLAFRSGAAIRVEPYEVPHRLRPLITAALQELQVDFCHVEAIPVGDHLSIIDINPLPTSDGTTLSKISQHLALVLNQKFGQTNSKFSG